MSLVYNWVLDSGISPVPPCPTVVTESVEERDGRQQCVLDGSFTQSEGESSKRTHSYNLIVKVREGNVFSHVCLSVILFTGGNGSLYEAQPQCPLNTGPWQRPPPKNSVQGSAPDPTPPVQGPCPTGHVQLPSTSQPLPGHLDIRLDER